jgi:pilus assembly protein FimV
VGITKLLGILLTITSVNAMALGLGEIELDSALNEELDATIELIDAGGLAPAEIVVSLASNEDFERVGVERFFFLTDLEFSVTFGENGATQIVLESSRPVTEPYLNFIVEVQWPNGRLLKEFTLLLDPPTFSQAAAPAVTAPVESSRSPATSGRIQRQQPANSAATRVQVAPENRVQQPSPLDQDVVGDEYQMTDRDDTLWSIAARTRPSNQVSVQQNMLAIQRLNPEAFINGNINLLKAGYTLRLPDEDPARTLSQNDAVASVASQNEAWKSGSAVPSAPQAPAPAATQVADDQTSELRSPVDATAATSAPSAAPATEGELRIVAGDGDSATGRADSADADVSVVLEENDRLARELEELNYQRERDQELVSNQLTVKDRQLEVKDKQIAELQQQLADAQDAPAPTPAQAQNQNTTDAKWWENPLVLYGGAGVLVLALVGGMLAARRRRDSDEDFYEAHEPVVADADNFAESSSFAALDDDDDNDGEAFAVSGTDDEAATDEELPDSETSDVIGEADIYIAYGRYPQAIGLLLGVLDDDPARNDVRLKLLELYSETNDRDAFDENLAKLVEHCDDEDALLTARELESRFGEKSISLDEVLADDAQGESNLEADSDLDDALADSTELELDTESDGADLAFDTETAPELTVDADTLEAPDDVGFELELDELESTADTALDDATTQTSAGELGGDLGMDFDPERDVAETALDVEAAAPAADDRGELPAFNSSTADEDDFNLDDVNLGGDLAAAKPGAEALAGVELESDGEVAVAEEDEFDFQEEGDSANTKLDLARAYIDMGDADGARDILKEVVEEGNSEQQQQARGMLESL